MRKITSLLLICTVLWSCKNTSEETKNMDVETTPKDELAEAVATPKLSLAQWSLHKKYQAEGANPFNFAKDAKALGFDAVEYVNQLYEAQIEELGLNVVIDSLISENKTHGVNTVLIMVDHEGDLADPDMEKRNQAVEDHKKWIDIAVKMGAHAIRVNTFGTNDPAVWSETVVDGLKKLSDYAATKNINVLCENHGWLSSDAPKLMKALEDVNMENCGTLPDFGNWCVKRVDGERWGACEEDYPDYYQGIELMMPRAKAVSAKAYNFNANGDEDKIDYYRMMQLVKDAGYTGHIGVEFEGDEMGEEEGIVATKKLVLKAAAQAK